ncbi:MAG: RAQPRD family integrative conjugative element protein [Rhodocyclaceae bacterium]
MEKTWRRTSTWLGSMALLPLVLAASFLALRPTHAADDTPERDQLATIKRQIDLLERTALHSANLARAERARYHFDHTRLREDLQRIRAGINDYLTPQRAQPRDPVELLGDYRQPDRPSDDEEPQ